jgi:hypothetical protein
MIEMPDANGVVVAGGEGVKGIGCEKAFCKVQGKGNVLTCELSGTTSWQGGNRAY